MGYPAPVSAATSAGDHSRAVKRQSATRMAVARRHRPDCVVADPFTAGADGLCGRCRAVCGAAGIRAGVTCLGANTDGVWRWRTGSAGQVDLQKTNEEKKEE